TDGSYSYTPALNYFGVDAFDVIASDGKGGTDQVTVDVTVTPVNDPPAAPDETATGEANLEVTGQLAATDPEGDPLSYARDTEAAHGTASVAPDGSWSYTPDADFSGEDSFGYVVDDGQGGSDTGTVFVTIEAAGGTYAEQFGTAGNDVLVGADSQRDALFGLGGDDTLIGRSGDDLLEGDAGIDRLEGGAGNDILRDGPGDDRLFGDAGDDLFEFEGGSDRAAGGTGTDTFLLTEAFRVNGTADKAKVTDYEANTDIVDLAGATVASYLEQNKRVILTLDTGD
ncbi:Ig-like domain-containing protein, partial [Tropicimonas marinistellae]|uniref:Ig-like domain-containing protein n=1 Tax=Tropicimonas marinistellae TaxID=1739787 RepID=UPI000B1713A3